MPIESAPIEERDIKTIDMFCGLSDDDLMIPHRKALSMAKKILKNPKSFDLLSVCSRRELIRIEAFTSDDEAIQQLTVLLESPTFIKEFYPSHLWRFDLPFPEKIVLFYKKEKLLSGFGQ